MLHKYMENLAEGLKFSFLLHLLLEILSSSSTKNYSTEHWKYYTQSFFLHFFLYDDPYHESQQEKTLLLIHQNM